MGRKPIGTHALSEAEKKARQRAQLAQDGGRVITVRLDADDLANLLSIQNSTGRTVAGAIKLALQCAAENS